MEERGELISNKLLLQALIVSMLLLLGTNLLKIVRVYSFQLDMLHNFATIFLSIILEGFPFIIIGALVSSAIQIFISEDIIAKMIPRNNIIGLLWAALVGILFPVCECAIIPIARRLIKKGVPVGMAITFMLAVPIVNPVVLISTYYAFLGQPIMAAARACVGAMSAIGIGYLIGHLHEGNLLKSNNKFLDELGCSHPEHQGGHCSCGDSGSYDRNLLSQIIGHTNSELYDIGKYFIFGALLSSAMQTFVPRGYITSIGKGNLSSILVMMAIAFVLSICSETDAFIARTFVGQFTTGSILAFLIFGPMIDIKNTIVLYGSFRSGFATKLIFLIVSVCFLGAVMLNLVGI